MKRCSVSLVIREMKIKIPVRYHYTRVRVAKIRKADNTKSRRSCGAAKAPALLPSARRPNRSGPWRILTKRNIGIPCDLDMPPLASYPRDMQTSVRNKTWTIMLIIALVIIAPSWKHLLCPSADERIYNSWYRIQWNSAQQYKGTNERRVQHLISERSRPQLCIPHASRLRFQVVNLTYCKKSEQRLPKGCGLTRSEAQGNFWADGKVYILVGWWLP